MLTYRDFERYCQLTEEIEDMEERIKRSGSSAIYATPEYSRGGRPQGTHGDKVGNAIANMDDYRQKLEDKKFLALQVREAIESLSDTIQRRILSLRYLDGLKVGAVAKRIHYSRKQCWEMEALAFRTLRIHVPKRKRGNTG